MNTFHSTCTTKFSSAFNRYPNRLTKLKVFYKGYFRHKKSKLALNFLAFLLDPSRKNGLWLIDDGIVGVQQILSQQIYSQLHVITNYGSRSPLFFSRTSFSLRDLNTSLLTRRCVDWILLDWNFKTLVWKGGLGVLPRKILKTKKAGEAISGHFAGAILP